MDSQKNSDIALIDEEMVCVDFLYANWNIEEVVNVLGQVKKQIEAVRKVVFNGNAPKQKHIEVFCINVQRTLKWWMTNTYVGKEKNSQIKMAFQEFYQALYYLLITFKESNIYALKRFANEVLYQGRAYRYIGYGQPCDSMMLPKRIIYNDIYVSWSKDANVLSMLKSKLHGKITKITCEISDEYYGIDLMAFFNTPINEENEVVFPTIKKLVVKTEIII